MPTARPILLSALFGFPLAALADGVPVLAPVEVQGASETSQGPTLRPAQILERAPQDSADLLNTVPGAAVNRNGPLTGIVQLRGLEGDRVGIRVDDMTITPACPNRMDPPLHYIAPQALETLTVIPGIAPVSTGPGAPAGAVLAERKGVALGPDAKYRPGGELGLGLRGNNGAISAYLAGQVANEVQGLRLSGSAGKAANTRFRGGTIADTGYSYQAGDIDYARRLGRGRLDLSAGLHNTWDAGTPALGMDMIYDKSQRYRAKYSGQGPGPWARVETSLYHHRVDHLMDNYSLRPNTGMRMFAPAESRDTGGKLSASLAAGGGLATLGADFHVNSFDAYQQNAATGAAMDMFNNARSQDLGVFSEWSRELGRRWTLDLGARLDRYVSDADVIVRSNGMTAAAAAAFNAAERRQTDWNWDATAKLSYLARADLSYSLGVARKTRSPSLLERYLWTPLAANAGLSDGRRYLGDVNLRPEVSYQANLGLDWRPRQALLTVNLFYNQVHDYIQGARTPAAIAAGADVLQFANLDKVMLYGIDGQGHYDLGTAWRLTGQAAYVRGRRLGDGDSLYRIAPLWGTLGLWHRRQSWQAGLETRLVAPQNAVAAFNGEQRTPGYQLLNLRARFTPNQAWQVDAGIENLLNRYYVDHLNGINRVAGSDVPVGGKLPGAGINVYLQASYRL
ncbi:TonB-dependent receptor [Thermithiobacillus tepidarius DSM 3134]|uniref:TonB-dependent receptor domain-containing protein n=1 Tax=Thermithiobacillus tepidarius TaxID=929 RepID=UPI000424AB10|nr:TonB-dependent receptor [Thermithiobacillus tepidarius]